MSVCTCHLEEHHEYLKHLALLIADGCWSECDKCLEDCDDCRRLILKRRSSHTTVRVGVNTRTVMFQWACFHEAPTHILMKILQKGGRDTVALNDSVFESNSLIWACTNRCSLDVIRKLVAMDSEALTMPNRFGNFALGMACRFDQDYEVIKFLLEKGGRDTLLIKNNFGELPIHHACQNASDYRVIELFLGENTGYPMTLSECDADGRSCVEHACLGDASVEKMAILLERFIADDNTEILHKNTIAIFNWTKNQSHDVKLEFLDKPFMKNLLNEHSVHPLYLSILMTDFYSQLALVGIFSLGIDRSTIQGEGMSDILIKCLCLGISWKIFRELHRISSTPLDMYIKEIGNWFHLILIVFVVWAAYILSHRNILTDVEGTIIALTTGFVWVHLLFVISHLRYEVAVLVKTMESILLKLIFNLLTAVLVIVFSFGNAFFILNAVENEQCDAEDGTDVGSVCSLSESYLATFTMLLSGEWILFTQPSLKISSLVSIAFAVVAGMFLLNMIAEITNAFTDMRKRGNFTFWHKRLHLTTEISSILSGFTCLNCRKIINRPKDGIRGRLDFNEIFRCANVYDDIIHHMSKEERSFFFWFKNAKRRRRAPSIFVRIKCFLKYSVINQIVIPGRVFETVLTGKSRNLGTEHISRVFLLLLYPISLVLLASLFIIGLFSFGLLWPQWMRMSIFNGPLYSVEHDTTSQRIEVLEEKVSDTQKILREIVDVLRKEKEPSNSDIQFVSARFSDGKSYPE